MRFQFEHIPELEYQILFSQSFCLEVEIKEEKLECTLVSSRQFQKKLESTIAKAFEKKQELVKALRSFLTWRKKVLSTLKPYAPKIYPFAEVSQELETETEEEFEERLEELTSEVPVPDLEEEIVEEDRCIHVIAKNTKTFSTCIQGYIEAYTRLCRLIIKTAIKDRNSVIELISQLANIDIVEINQRDSSASILIPLDFSPQRLALALNSQAVLDGRRTDTLYIPPIVARRIKDEEVVFHAYRSIDDYPVLFPAIHMEEREIGSEREKKFRRAIADASRLLYMLKRGRRGIRFPLSDLSQILAVYFQKFPYAKDRFYLLDLGGGRGGLLKGVVDKFMKKYATNLLDYRSSWIVALNDLYEEERTGEEFVTYAATDRASQYIREIRKIIRDIGKAVNDLKYSNIDVCFLNRVLDMYAKYGFYYIKTGEHENPLPSAVVAEEEDAEYRGVVLVYSDLVAFKDIYNLQRQLLRHEPLLERTILPGISYNLKKDFFMPREFALEDLLEMAKLVVISIFPATKQTLFANLLNKDIHVCSIGQDKLQDKPRYIVFCLSKDKDLIEAISKTYADGA